VGIGAGPGVVILAALRRTGPQRVGPGGGVDYGSVVMAVRRLVVRALKERNLCVALCRLRR
jgi:hypothetical protein